MGTEIKQSRNLNISEPHLNLQKFPVRNGIKERPGKVCIEQKHQSSTALAPDSSERLRRTGFLGFVFL